MRTLNVRLAVVLAVIAVVFGSGVYLLHGYQVRNNADMFLEQADRAEERAKAAAEEENDWLENKAYNDAIRCLYWYVRLMPEEVEVRERLGLMLADRFEEAGPANRNRLFRQAFGQLETTVGLGPGREVARRRLVKMFMSIGRYQDAREHLEDFLLKSNPEDAELLEQLGQCRLRTGEYDAARKTFGKAIECGPDRATAYASLAGLLRSRFSRPEEADKLMDQLVEVNPRSARAHLLRGRYLLSAGSREEALREATKGLELAPDDLQALLLASVCHRVNGRLEEARRCAARGIELQPDSVIMHLTLSEIERRAGNEDEAVAVLERGLKATDRHLQILYNLADLLIDIDRVAEARRFIEELQSEEVPHHFLPRIEYLLARTEFVQGNWLRARRGFEKIRRAPILAGDVNEIDVWIGECYGRLGNREQQEKVLRRVLNRDPTFAPAVAALMNANLARGNLDEALEGFRQLAGSGRASASSALALSRMLLMKNLRLPPEKRNWKAVENALDAAEKALPDSPQVVIYRADALLAQDRDEEAEKLLREARDKNPAQSAFWNALISLADNQGDWEQAEKLLHEADKLFGDSPERRTIRARHLVRRHGKDAAGRLRELARNTEAFSEEQLVRLWRGLLGAAQQVGDDRQIDLLCRRIAGKRPNDVNVRYFLFERALRKADRPAMEKALEEIERVAGQGSVWLYGKAVLLYLDGQEKEDETARKETLNRALAYLAKARETREDWSRIPMMEAGIHDALGEPDKALEGYLHAFDMGDRNPTGIKRAVQLLLRAGRYAEAGQMLRQIERERVELSPVLCKAAAEVALRQDDDERALEMTRKIAAADSNDFQDHLWLGHILDLLGRRAKADKREDQAAQLLGEAEKALRRAVELEPKLPQTWLALISHYGVAGEANMAEKTLEEAGRNIPEDDAPLALAQCHEILHKPEEAAKEYEAALAADPEDMDVVRAAAQFYARSNQLPSAEAQLKRIIEGKVSGDGDDVAWARRRLALIHVARGGYENLQKARTLIEQNLADSESSTVDRRFMARLSASDPRRARREQALGIISEMVDEQKATPEDLYAGAKMHESAGNWIEAGNLYRTLVATYPKEPRFLVAYIEALLRHEEYSSAGMYIDRLEGLAPKWFVTIALKADLLCAKNQPDAAFDLLKQFVDQSDPQSKDRDARLRLTADKLTQLGRGMSGPEQKRTAEKFLDQAETWFRDYVEAEPRRKLLLAAFLGAREKVDEALGLLEHCLQHSSPQDFSRVCILLSQTAMTDEQTRRLDQILEKAIKRFDRHSTMLSATAELRSRQQRYAESEKLYREVLDKTPGNAVAMNNLAVLLALQGVKLDEALKLVDKAIEIAGPLGAMLDSRASVYMAMGKAEKALEDISAAVADDDSPVRLFHQAQAYKLVGRDVAARKTMEKALEKKLAPEMLQPLELPAFEELKKSLE